MVELLSRGLVCPYPTARSRAGAMRWLVNRARTAAARRSDSAAFAALVPQIAKAYQVDESGHATLSAIPTDPLNASVGLITTVRDLAKFDAALDQAVLLRPETVIGAWSARVGATGLPQPMGLGWFSQIVNGQPVVWHFGYTPNASSALLLKLPNRHISFILLANSDALSAQFSLASGDITTSPFAQLILSLLR